MKKFEKNLIFCFILAFFSCNIFRGEAPCDESECLGNDEILFFFKSKTDGHNLLDAHDFSLDDVEIVPILHKTGGQMPNLIKGTNSTNSITTFMVGALAHENTRGFALRLATFSPDTVLVTTGLVQGKECCGKRTTFSQISLNGVPIAPVGTQIKVDILK